jgi:hypothetical protein
MGAAALAMVAATASAQLLAGPPKAKSIKGELVNAYVDCASPSKTTNPPIVLPACNTVIGDPDCFLDAAKGKGKWQATVVQKGGTPTTASRDIAVKASISGLAATCIGETLTLTADSIVSTDDCTSGDCTIQQLNGFPTGACLVENAGGLGKCNVNGTVEGFVGTQTPMNDVFKVGKRYSVTILGVHVVHDGDKALDGGVMLQP